MKSRITTDQMRLILDELNRLSPIGMWTLRLEEVDLKPRSIPVSFTYRSERNQKLYGRDVFLEFGIFPRPWEITQKILNLIDETMYHMTRAHWKLVREGFQGTNDVNDETRNDE